MIELPILWWLLITIITSNGIVDASCVVTHEGKTRTEEYQEYDYHYGRQYRSKIIVVESEELLCSQTYIAEIYHDSKRNPNMESKMFVKDSNISSLSPNTYDWAHLIEFHMENTNTTQIIPGFFNKFDKLTILEITNNKIETLMDWVFGSLTTLTSLNLSRNCITVLTSHTFSGLLHLNLLDLSKNKISHISTQVLDNQNFLMYVDMSQNSITDVFNIFNKTSLETIILSKNQLSNFNFEQLIYNSNLVKVDLAENKIKTIINVANITNLNVSYNCLEMINNTMLNYNMQSLDLSNNNVIISEESFNNTNKLEYLYLANNSIKSLPRETFKELKDLKHLDLAFNKINQMQFGLFNDLNDLEYLDLSNNNMLLDFHILTTLKSLKMLKIQNNKIINFNAQLLVNRFKNLNFVALGNNLWNCSELANTIHLLQKNNIAISSENNTKTNNILGISCKDDVDFKEESIMFIQNNQTIPQEVKKDIDSFINRAYHDYLQNSTFYRLLENISLQISKENFSVVPTSTNQNSFIQYLNQNFTQTNFYKYIEGLKQFENKTQNTFSHMMNFFDTGFNQTNFYKYFNSLRFSPNYNNKLNNTVTPVTFSMPNQTVQLLSYINSNMSENFRKVLEFLALKQHDVSSSASQPNDTIEKLIQNDTNDTLKSVRIETKLESQALNSENFTNYRKTFRDDHIFTNILLVLILCSIMAQLYLVFWKPRNGASAHEQVQLM